MLRLLVPLVLGVVSVIQAGMNRRVGTELGWPVAALLNNFVLFVISVVFCLMRPPAQGFGAKITSGAAVYALPGLFGIVLVMGIPWAISKWGATVVFVGLIVSQVLASFLWDAAQEGRGLGNMQVAGVLLSLTGALLMNLRA